MIVYSLYEHFFKIISLLPCGLEHTQFFSKNYRISKSRTSEKNLYWILQSFPDVIHNSRRNFINNTMHRCACLDICQRKCDIMILPNWIINVTSKPALSRKLHRLGKFAVPTGSKASQHCTALKFQIYTLPVLSLLLKYILLLDINLNDLYKNHPASQNNDQMTF